MGNKKKVEDTEDDLELQVPQVKKKPIKKKKKMQEDIEENTPLPKKILKQPSITEKPKKKKKVTFNIPETSKDIETKSLNKSKKECDEEPKPNMEQLEDKKQLLIESFKKLAKQEQAKKEVWKAKAYYSIVKELTAHNKPIYTIDDVKDLKGVGAKSLAKIKELLEAGTIKQLENYNSDGKLKVFEDLTKVHGIGPVKARDLIDNHGIKSIEDLKAHPELLNDKQLMGLKYYEDFLERIPRKEMVKHDTYLHEVLAKVDPKLNGVLTGSYRREAADSGDIDILLSHPDEPENAKDLFRKVVDTLVAEKYIVDTFALGDKKCMAVCKMKRHKKFRRIDLLYTPKNEFPFAILYFTGSDKFNIEMRNIALSKGYSLSEHGMKYASGAKAGEYIDHEFADEKSIFDFLGMEYVEPHLRSK